MDLNRFKNRTLYEAILDSKNRFPKRKAFYYKGKYFDYTYLVNRINSFANELTNLGYKENDVITLCLPNIPEVLYLLYSVNQIGAIANLIHPLMSKDELKEILLKVNSKTLFVLDSRYKDFKEFEELGIKVYPINPVHELPKVLSKTYNKINEKNLEKECLEKEKEFEKFYEATPLKDFNKDYLKDSIFLHSGGTTGKSKTIALSSFSINSMVTIAHDVIDYKDGEVAYMLSVLPIFHGFGLAICIHFCLALACCDMLMPKFKTRETINLLKKKKVNFIVGVPTLFEALLRKKNFKGRKLKSLRVCFVGGDFVSDSLLERFNNRLIESHSNARLYQGYGLTETVTVCSVNTLSHHKDKTVGRPLYNVDIKVIDESLNLLETNKQGEFIVSGETLMNGYRFGNEDDNEKVFITINNKKYVRTGDYGYIDDENYLHFIQRIKRLIKVNGINVFPSEIENSLFELPYIYEATVIGVSDEKHGNLLKVFIVLDKNITNLNHEKIKDEVSSFIVNKFSIYAKPKEVVILDSLPKTLIGKIDVKKLS